MIDKAEFLSKFEKYLAALLDGDTSRLDEVARYCALDGGKRIRPVCVYLGALAAGGNCEEEQLLALAAGIELVHCYSLVHDDLPAMDNAATRRGKPSAHVAFGEANAILAGDLLLSLSFDHLAGGCARFGEKFCLAAKEISSAAADMAHGQATELAGIDGETAYLAMCEKKTGALILGALRAGAILAGASDKALGLVTDYGKALGLLFQISDDILDGDGIVALSGRERADALMASCLDRATAVAAMLQGPLVSFAQTVANRAK